MHQPIERLLPTAELKIRGAHNQSNALAALALGHAVGLPLAPMFGLAFVPAANYPEPSTLPAPALHSFYDRRVGDVDDALLKVSGYWASQWAVSSRFMRSLVGGQRATTS